MKRTRGISAQTGGSENMKIAIALTAAALLGWFGPEVSAAQTKGHYRSNGKYVQPYQRTMPNAHRYDNYSSRGNVNPYTGKRGSKRNEFTNPPAYNKPRSNGYRR